MNSVLNSFGILALLSYLIVLSGCSQSKSKVENIETQDFPIRAWQLHELKNEQELTYVEKVIEEAPKYDVNTLVFSHGMVGAVHDLYESGDKGLSEFKGMEHGRVLNKLAEDAGEKGLKTWIWIHELENIPEKFIKNGIVQLDDEGIYDFLKERYRKVFEDFPAFDGIMLTFHETRYKLFDDTEAVSSLTPSERFAKITNTINEVCREFDKDLIVRTFVYTMEELEWARRGFAQTDTDVMIQSKTVPQDWEPFFPHNPVIGSFPDRKHIIEFDCSNEYTGKNYIPYTSPEYFAFRWTYDLKQKGVAGYNIRLDHNGYDALFTPNAINIYTLQRLTEDSSVSPSQIWKEWTTDNYGKDAAPYVEAALKPSFEIVNKAFFPWGFWFTKHSGLPEYQYGLNHITGHTSVAHWWPEDEPGYNMAPWWPEDVSQAAWKQREQTLIAPDPVVYEQLVGEKDTAMILAEKALYHLNEAAPYLTKEQYNELYELLMRLKLTATIRRMHAEAWFGIRVLASGHEVPGLKERINRAIDNLYMLEQLTHFNTPMVDDTTAYHQPPAVPWKTRKVADQLRAVLNDMEF